MKFFLFIMILLSYTNLSGQNEPPKDAVYRHLTRDCDIIYSKPVKKFIAVTDSFVLFYSDSGKVQIEKEEFNSKLEFRDKKYRFTETELLKDSLVKYLFLHNILNYDNLLKVSISDRTAVSQYGDTVNTTLSVNSATIKLYDIVWINKTGNRRTRSFNFDIRFIYENNPYSIYLFELNIETERKVADLKKILSTEPKLKCLRYIGFEI